MAAMQTCRLAVLLLSCCVCSTLSRPSRPLNERSADLAWEAWLLVDEQQNQRHPPLDGPPRRRITPKSVFIAPTFSPETLPACADGYGSDAMGRCMKIIRIDPDRQYDFLIEKLKEKFAGSFDYDEEEEEEEEVVGATQGPFQLNIPLEIDGEDMRREQSEDESVALIVSPTKPYPHVPTKNKLDKRYSILNDEQAQEMYLQQLAEATTRPQEDLTTEDTPTTSEPESTTTITTTEEPHVSTPDPLGQADDPSTFVDASATPQPGIFNRRNRDRHNGLFFLPPPRSGPGLEEPIVLRFSRRQLGARDKALRHTEYYRSIPTDDFAYLFKFKHKVVEPV